MVTNIPETIKLAIDRLAGIQAEERILKKEKEELRKATFDVLIKNKWKKVLTGSGHTASLSSRVTEAADKEYILSVLTEEQKLIAYTTKVKRILKIT